MKTLQFTSLLLLIILSFSSCQEEEIAAGRSAVITNKKELLGQWVYSTITSSSNEPTKYEHSECGLNNISFTEDNREIETIYKSTRVGNQIICNEDQVKGYYAIEEDAIIMFDNHGGEKQKAIVEKVSNDRLVLIINGDHITFRKLR